MNEHPALFDRLLPRLRRFFRGQSTDTFNALALDLHGYQVEHSRVIASLTKSSPRHWSEIPSVPIDLFKHVKVGIMGDGAPIQFRTSGTSEGRRGVHHLLSTDIYDESSLIWAGSCLGALPSRVAATLSDPNTVDDSSLAHMVGLWAPEDTTWHVRDGKLDGPGLTARVKSGEAPLFLASTAFALVDWLEQGAQKLPPGSRLMITGGFKGRVRELEATELYEWARRDIVRDIVLEYGMTELSSQLWSVPDQPYLPPPWMRVRALRPGSNEMMPEGEPGQLQFFDLANVYSTIGVLTMDYGSVDRDGKVTLHGRLPQSEARGCSLTIEEGWARID